MEIMSGGKLDVIWSPVHQDKFIVWGQDITLYEVSRLQDIEKNTTFTQLSSTRGAVVIASQSGSGVRCVDISAIADHPDPLLALGHASGRVTLTSLKQTYDPLGLVGREFVARYPRPCNSVAWSRSEHNLLAVGLEKHRSDNCILLWDVNTCTPDDFTERDSPPASDTAPAAAEVATGETAHTVSWCAFAPRTLVASMNLKQLKIYDLRESGGKACGVATTRQCFGASAAPHGWQLASRGEAGVAVWDARALAQPLLMLPLPRPPRKIQWSPTRRNLLISLQRDSSSLRLHDIQQAHEYKAQDSFDSVVSASSALEESEAEVPQGSALERDVSVCGAPLAAFACHPTHCARLLALTASGSPREYTVTERVSMSWGAAGTLAWAGAGALRRAHASLYAHVPDISHVARARAITDYGLKPDLWQNADLADDEALSGLWHFLALSKSLVEDGCIRNSPWKHPGVRSVLRSPGEGYRSEGVAALLPDLPNRKVTVYRSAERTRALQLCGWGWGWENAGVGVERAEAAGTPCRAAALAAFHLRLRTALDVLARAQEPRSAERTRALQLCGWGWGWENAGVGVERAEAAGTPCRAAALAAFHLRLRTALDVLARAQEPRSAERTRALQLCGWGWGWENAGVGVERAEAAGTPCRAAALAAFHLRLRTALDVLARAQEPRLRVAALALAPGDDRLWREALAAAAPSLPDPYLRAMLHFLAAANCTAADAPPDYTAVLNETEMRLEDRVAFACTFLSDTKLHEYVTRTCDELRARGDLAALLLTGISNEGVAVLQTWLENTGDVQSAALVAARCCPPELLRDGRVRAWLAEYRQLLDAWRLWWPRCLLDTWAAAAGAGDAGGAGAGAGVACTYCGKPVAAAAHARPRPAFARLPPPAAKMKQISSCPNCRKPLPRCGVCSLHLGTGAGGVAALPAAPPAPAAAAAAAPAPANTFGGWFSWCVACRHGGHAAHLLTWFSEHSECPVSSCSCRCSALDPPDPAPRPPATPS